MDGESGESMVKNEVAGVGRDEISYKSDVFCQAHYFVKHTPCKLDLTR